jgi:hypothetical protein
MEDNIELDNLNRPERAEGGEDETVIDDTPVDEDDFITRLDDLRKEDDNVRVSTFREENRNDRYSRRRDETFELGLQGGFSDIKSEYVRRLQKSDYHINPNDGPFSKKLISSLNITKNKLIFRRAKIAYIDVDGSYKKSTSRKFGRQLTEYEELYDKALVERRQRARSVVEEETTGGASGETTEDIHEDAREVVHRETVVVNENFLEDVERFEREGIITAQERREFAGVTAPKGPPEVRIKALKAQKVAFETDIELETNPDRQHIRQRAVDVTERGIDDARLEMGQQPESEEGKHRYRETVREDIRTKFERFRKWAKENLGALTAISIAGIITTVVVAGKKAIVGASKGLRSSKGLGAVGKALAGLAKSALPILVPILNLLSTILSWGAKGLTFLAQNLWIIAILIAGAIYKYLQGRRKK